MLVANLNFYPDARNASKCMRLGMLIFHAKDGRGLIGFVEWQADLAEARASTADPVLRSILDAPGSFLRRLGAAAGIDAGESALANAVAAGLPYNLSIEEPRKPQPPEMEDLFALVAAEEVEHRYAFAD